VYDRERGRINGIGPSLPVIDKSEDQRGRRESLDIVRKNGL